MGIDRSAVVEGSVFDDSSHSMGFVVGCIVAMMLCGGVRSQVGGWLGVVIGFRGWFRLVMFGGCARG